MKEQSIAFAEWLHNNGWIGIDYGQCVVWYNEENSIIDAVEDGDYFTTDQLYIEFINTLK